MKEVIDDIKAHPGQIKWSLARYYTPHGQGDTWARPASAPMANDTIPLRGHGIICAG